MGIIRRLLPLALVVAAAAPASAEYVQYATLRADNPAIDETVALLSSSDINGTFNRISALFTRGTVRDLPAGTAYVDLPANVRRNLENALEDLGDDLIAADADLAALGLSADELLRRQWILTQVVYEVFSKRMLELSIVNDESGYPIACAASEPDILCPYDGTVATQTLDAFNDQLLRDPNDDFNPLPLALWISAVRDSAYDEDGFNEFSNSGIDPRDFVARVERLQTTSPVLTGNTLVHGEPIID